MVNWLKSLSKAQKRAIMLILDSTLILVALAFAFAIQTMPGGVLVNLSLYLPAIGYVGAAAAGVSLWLGICSIQLNSYEAEAIGQTAILAAATTVASIICCFMFGIPMPLNAQLVFGFFFFALVVISRAVLLQVVLGIYRRSPSRCRVLIYGAGSTGTQLVSALRGHEDIEPVAFVDDNKSLQGVTISRLPVYTPMRIAEVVKEKRIDRVLLAVPSLSQPKKARISRELREMGLDVQAVPSFAQLIGQEALVERLTPVSAQSFLNRDEVDQTMGERLACYTDKVVMVTGAGGSIGSELCRQIMEGGAKKLVLFELSELALYSVDMEFCPIARDHGIEVVPVLGSVTDARLLRKVMKEQGVEVVLHAAAYKHVPLVEANPLAGLVNNVFGTQTLGEQAALAGVERFILISSDKAVRPTNVMGASKRLAEQVVQDLARRTAKDGSSDTIFTMVRFGNVLGSSGSVVPLFQEQLSRGGPLTVTDRSVARFFMTVQEAVSLVLHAGAIAQGGEVFVLDMGKPVPIVQLARQVIERAGYTVRDDAMPDGDIEIKITGLRPGEKICEELTLTGDLLKTEHPKIFAACETAEYQIDVPSALRQLREAFVASDEDMARAVVREWVEDFAQEQKPALPRSSQIS